MNSLTDTILTERRAGTDKTAIIKLLLASGHPVAEINAAFNALDARPPAPAPASVPAQAPGVTPASLPASAPPPAPPVMAPPTSEPTVSLAPPPVPAPAPAIPALAAQTPVAPASSAAKPSGPIAPGPSWFSRFTRKNLLALAALALAIGVATGTAYAYIEGIGPFANAPYAEDNFLTGLLRNSADIRSATYEAAFALSVGERDEDAVPFVSVADPNAAVNEAAYSRDVERMHEANSILSNLRITKPYPVSLANLKPRYGTLDIKDPNGSVYGYSVINGGTDFSLTVTFETPAAIQAVAKTVSASSATTTIRGMAVTFSETSRTVYLSSKPPKTYFEELEDMVKRLPAEMNATVSLGGTTAFGAEQSDWKFNVAGSGDFGDLTYALDVDVLKKDTTHYFRLNKFPSLFLGAFDIAKGEWVKVESSATSSARSLLSLSSVESSYKEQRAEIAAFLVDAARIADEEGLFAWRSAPRQETVDGRRLYRYDLRLSEDAIEPFNARLKAAAESGSYPSLAPYVTTPTYSSAPSTPEARKAMYEYYDKNARLTVWVDEEGRLAIIKSSMRIVPPDDAKQLAGKQVNTELTLTLGGINEPIVIEAPADAKSLEEVMPSPSLR